MLEYEKIQKLEARGKSVKDPLTLRKKGQFRLIIIHDDTFRSLDAGQKALYTLSAEDKAALNAEVFPCEQDDHAIIEARPGTDRYLILTTPQCVGKLLLKKLGGGDPRKTQFHSRVIWGSVVIDEIHEFKTDTTDAIGNVMALNDPDEFKKDSSSKETVGKQCFCARPAVWLLSGTPFEKNPLSTEELGKWLSLWEDYSRRHGRPWSAANNPSAALRSVNVAPLADTHQQMTKARNKAAWHSPESNEAFEAHLRNLVKTMSLFTIARNAFTMLDGAPLITLPVQHHRDIILTASPAETKAANDASHEAFSVCRRAHLAAHVK